MRPALRIVFRSSKYKALALLVGGLYWLVYALSSGMVFYYRSDVTALLASSGVPNPYFVISLGSFENFYLSGVVWYPSGHFQLNLLIGPTFFSFLLSSLFALSVVLLAYGVRLRGVPRRPGIAGFAAVIPAIFSGGCCSAPLGLALLGTFLSSTALFSFVYEYAFAVNAAVAILLYASNIYAANGITLCALRGEAATKDR